MSNVLIALFAYLIDRLFGEFKFAKHPMELIGETISFFETKFYKDSILRGFLLVLFVLSFMSIVSISFYQYLAFLHPVVTVLLSAFLASIFISHKSLYEDISNIAKSENKKELIAKWLPEGRETTNQSDIYKIAVETYAKDINSSAVAPLFYLAIFGLPGIIIYQTIKKLDSMVGYKNERYKKYGKVSAILDDIVNYIPARITALMIMIVMKQKNFLSLYTNGKKHESLNTGYPITAMAQGLDLSLGGDAYYFGTLQEKATFGNGRKRVGKQDLENAIAIRNKIDVSVFVLLTFISLGLFFN